MAVPTLLATLAICIVFVPVFLLQGTAKYLFSPLSTVGDHFAAGEPGAVVHAGAGTIQIPDAEVRGDSTGIARWTRTDISQCSHRAIRSPRFITAFERGFQRFPQRLSQLRWRGRCSRPLRTAAFFVLLRGESSCFLFPQLGMDFFPQVDAGQMRLHVRCAAGHEARGDAGADFAHVEQSIRRIVGEDQIEVMLDNIGLPYSGINIALSDTATVGPMDGEILDFAEGEALADGRQHMADLRTRTAPAISAACSSSSSRPTSSIRC